MLIRHYSTQGSLPVFPVSAKPQMLCDLADSHHQETCGQDGLNSASKTTCPLGCVVNMASVTTHIPEHTAEHGTIKQDRVAGIRSGCRISRAALTYKKFTTASTVKGKHYLYRCKKAYHALGLANMKVCYAESPSIS